MEVKTQSGATVHLPVAPWRDAVALKNAIHREFSASSLKIDLGADIGTVAKIILMADSSDEIYQAVLKCLNRGTYNNIKITEATFEPEGARQDWYDVLEACLKVNYFPFVEGLRSKYNTALGVLRGLGSQK